MTKQQHSQLVKSGMFWETYPELTGNWNEDKNKFNEDVKMNYEITKQVLKPANERIVSPYTNKPFMQHDIKVEGSDQLFWINSNKTSGDRWRQEINTPEETLVVYTIIKTDTPFPSTSQLINNLMERKTVKAFVECNK